MRNFSKLFIAAFLLLVLLIPTTVLGNEGGAELDVPEFRNASVHDPSIIKDKDSDTYYVFGSHVDGAKSIDLINWDSFTNGYTTPDNQLYGDLSKNLAESFAWAGEDDADSSGGFAVWAPDIFWNKDYLNQDGTTGAYTMYYSVSSTYIRSAIGMAVSKDIEGPYQYVDTIMYSGFTNYEAYDNSSDVNKHWENTNIADLIDDGIFDEVNPDWFTSEETGNYNNALYTNAIDANILYGKDGALWMTYGSWSGGTFVLELDKETGQPLYPGVDGQTEDGRMIDRYFGTKIAGGYGRSGEGTYAVYDEDAGYYYLYITYGGLASDGGYQMRQFRSEDIEGPFVDAAGNEAVFPESFDEGVGNFPSMDDHKEIGNKMMGNFLFKRDLGEAGTGIGTGYAAPGHNSYYADADTGKEFLVTHTRFPEQGETHEVRVHQTFKNTDQWPVPTAYRYAGETIETVSTEAITGDYKYINHGKEITGDVTDSTWVKLNADNTISGAVSGTWELYEDYRVKLSIGENTYDGVFIRQWDPTSESWVMTFSAMSGEGVVIWGSHVESSSDDELVAAIKTELSDTIPTTVISDVSLQTVATRGTQISWESSEPEVLSNDGTVVRPRFGMRDAPVELTATITLGDVTETLAITTTVLAEAEGGLSAYYNFSDNLIDQSGKQDDATVTGNRINNEGGSITFEDGVVGQAAKFDGESGLRLADGLISSDTYAVSLWMNPEEITGFTTTFFGARTESNWISFVPSGPVESKSELWVHNGADWYDAVPSTNIPANEWTHVAFTVNKGNIVVYINGEAQFTGDAFPDIFTSLDAVFGLGVNYWDIPFKGLMDEVRIYDGMALSETDVNDLYQNPIGLTANYDFDNDLEEKTGKLEAGTITGDRIDNTGGTISYDSGIDGQAAVFNGESGIRLPNGLIDTDAYTVSLWLNPEEINDFTTTFFGTKTNSEWVSVVPISPIDGDVKNTNLMADSNGARYNASIGETIPTNTWTHVAFTVDNGEITVYINGEQAFTGTDFPDVFSGSDASFGLGVNYWDAPYKGLMDDLRIYGETAVSEDDIKEYYELVLGEYEEPEEEPEPELDTTELEALIETAKGYSEEDYTDESFAELLVAITEAEEALVSIDSEESLVAAINALQASIDGLIEQVKEEPEPEIDVTELEVLIEKAKEVNTDGYTETTFAALKESIKQAEEALVSIDSEDAVAAAISELQQAINELIIAEVDAEKVSDIGELEFVDNVYKTNLDAKITVLTAEVLEKLEAGTTVEMVYGSVKAAIPVELLKTGEDVTFSFNTVSGMTSVIHSDALSTLYDFTLTSGDEDISLDTPVTLTFTVDPTKVTDWENVQVSYINEDNEKQEEIISSSYDAETFKVVAEVNHFSIYGVFEITEVDVTDLVTLIETAKEILVDGYTESSFSALQTALTAAEEALETIDSEETLTAAITALQAAIDGLEVVEQEPEPEIDTTELEALIDTAKEINADGYTEASFASLQAAITEAEQALESIDSEEVLTGALTALQAGIDGLEELQIKEPVVPSEPGEPTPTPVIDETDETEVNDTDSEQDNLVEETDTDEVSEEESTGEKLPETATNQFNWLVLGGALLVIGFGSFIVLRRRKNQVN
ncbi:LamG-like jellyroll fold domain-containing protein [Paraliobacillus sediminis]|uniref:LamG-like jellyroll fold domain-containing protein n=1 Tax=Paraliobacillus sediminis TaxID=1885916 RepID=UPI000E3E709D|nr:LamG-like jellyroll fold domain-containing protein [Paraliobacillus sediminis]